MSILIQKKQVLFFACIVLATPVAALQCTFTTECFETDGCSDTQFATTWDKDANVLSTDFGDLSILNHQSGDGHDSLTAVGDGATYLLTITPDGARLTTHMTEGPMMVNYSGACE